MRNQILTTLTILIALSFTSCKQEQPQMSDDQKAEIVIEVKEMLNDYHSEIKNNGLIAELKYLDNSKDFLWTPPGFSKPISYDSVLTILKQNAPNYKAIDNVFESLSIEAISSDSAIYSGRIRSMITDTIGTTTTLFLNEKGKLIKRQDGWKLLNGETTISLN